MPSALDIQLHPVYIRSLVGKQVRILATASGEIARIV
jgi:hypothetical protein